jgi:hypothetical protein
VWRSENAAGYLAITEEGTELLLLGSNGSRLSHVVRGIDLDKALAAGPETNWRQGVGYNDNLLEIEKAQPPPPYVSDPEPEPHSNASSAFDSNSVRDLEPEPEPVKPKERRQAKAPEPPADPLLDASARYIAKRVWAMGSRWPADIFPRGLTKSACDEVLNYGVAMGWIVVEPSSRVVRGAVHPEPLMTYRIPNDATPRYLG